MKQLKYFIRLENLKKKKKNLPFFFVGYILPKNIRLLNKKQAASQRDVGLALMTK